MTARRTLLHWLAEDELPRVFQGLFYLADKYGDEQLRNNATFQSGRLKALEKEKINGTVSQEEDNLQSAKIRQALLQIVQGLDSNWIMDSSTDFNSASTKRNWIRTTALIAFFATLLAGVTLLTENRLSDIFQKKNTNVAPAKIHPPSPNVSTSGDNSPGIISHDGDVIINYGASNPKEDSINSGKRHKK